MNKAVLGVSIFILSMFMVSYIALGLPIPGYIDTDNSSTVVSKSTSPTLTPTQKLPTEYKLSEIALHRRENDCWMSIEGSVYDVSDYATDHPGGRMDLLAGCGIDATELYTTGKAGRHHERAVAILESYKIGTLTQ